MRYSTIILSLSLCVTAVAQSPGTFALTGSMSTARAGHTATLLTNGKVLVAGGYQYQGSMAVELKSAEIYDPSVGVFTPAGDMSVPRSRHTATLLPDGRVLIAGGGSADVYDPATGTFTPAGKMNTGGTTAALLNSGKVLLAGGATGDQSSCSNNAELYDPATNTFQLTGNMTSGRCTPRATLLADGSVLVVPGDEGDDPGIADIYDPDTGSFRPADWQNIDNMIAATSNLLVNGSVLVSLAEQECDSLSTQAAVYDSASGFRTTGNMASGICRPTGTLLSDGTVLIAGGWFAGTVAQVYDPASGSFSPVGNLTTYRQEYAATLLNDGTVLMTGGTYPTGNPLGSYGFATSDTAELYHPGSVRSAPALLSLGASGQGAVLHAGTSRVVSASDPASVGEAIEIYGTGLNEGGVIPPQVSIGGRLAQVLFFGDAPGYPGLNQVNVLTPAGVASGGTVPVWWNYMGRPSNAVTIGVQASGK